MFNTGSTGFMLLATSLVMLMTPGLAFFYGGLAGKRNILGIMMQSFVSMGITTVMWFICGYSLCFSGDAMGGVLAGDAYERATDVEPGDPKVAQFGEGDREISGPGRDLEHARPGPQPRCGPPGRTRWAWWWRTSPASCRRTSA